MVVRRARALTLPMLPFFDIPMDVAQQGWVQVRAEERLRSGNDVTATETEIQPQLRYDTIWQGGQSHFVAIYQPRAVYTSISSTPDADFRLVNPATLSTYEEDPNAPGGFRKADPNKNPLSFLHNGGVGFEHVRRRWRLSLYQFGAYGPVTTTALLVQPVWNGVGIPADPNPIIPSTVAARFTLLFLQTQLFVPIRVSRRVAIIPGFVYNAFGGADSASRAALALTQGPGASVAVEVAATRNDRLTTTVGAGRVATAFEGDREGATIYRAEATQAWRHWYSNHLSTELSAGGAIGGDEINGFTAFSLTQAALLYDNWNMVRLAPGAPPQGGEPGHKGHFQAALVAKAAPWVDLFSGELEQRAVGIAAANYTIDRTTIRTSLATARVFNTPRSVARYSLFQAEGGVRFALTRTFSLDGGLRFGQQSFNNAIRFNDLTQATVYAGFMYAPLPARF